MTFLSSRSEKTTVKELLKWSTFAEVIAKIKVAPFFETQCAGYIQSPRGDNVQSVMLSLGLSLGLDLGLKTEFYHLGLESWSFRSWF